MTCFIIKLRLNIPLRILEELINIFAEHALEVLILQSLLAALLLLVTHLLDLGLAVCFVGSSATLRATLL